MAAENELNDIQKLLLESSPIFGESVASSLNNIFGCSYKVSEKQELVSRLHTENPHVIVMGFSNEDYQGIMFISFGNISILEENGLEDADSIQDPFGEVANQSIGIFNDSFKKYGHIEQAPPMYSNANSTSFPLAAGIVSSMINSENESEHIEFGFSIRAVFKATPIADKAAADDFVGIDLSDL